MDAGTARALVAEYYADPIVRSRLREYCGDTGTGSTAAFIAGLDPAAQPEQTWWDAAIAAPARLEELADHGGDLSRSLWDANALIFLLDLDYQNLDAPAEPFTHVTDVFFKLEHTYRATIRCLERSGIHPIVTATGRGYHVVGRIPLDDPVVDALATLSPVPPWLTTLRDRHGADIDAILTARQATAAAGLGRTIEFLAHTVLREAQPLSLVPVVVNGTAVGSGWLGRECVSIDFSHVGDPYDVRHVRLGLGAYQWHRTRPDIFGSEVAALPPFAAVPRTQSSLEAFLLAGRDFDVARRLARTQSNLIPDIAPGIARLVRRYGGSRLAAFHRDFDDERRLDASTADLQPPADLTPCVRRPIDRPNDLLLKPEYLQNLVRGLMARGWTPARIARLVGREYGQDHGWGDRWTRLDIQTRADFDVRVFAGLIVTGVDQLLDFNCTSSQEKGLCPFTGCAQDLRDERARLRTLVQS